MKKWIALLLAVMMALPLAACGNGGAGNSTPPSESGNKPSANVPDDGAAEELTVWCWDENFNIPIMETAANYYREAGHPNFKLNIVNVPEVDLESRAITAFTSGVSDGLPDIYLMGDYSAKNFLISYPGMYADLTDAIDASKFAPNKTACYTLDGRLYGVPLDSGSAGMYYRVDLFEQAGYTAEDLEDITWFELVEIAKKVKEVTGKYVFVFTPYKGTHYMQIALQSAGQWFYGEDGESANFVNNEVIRQMCEVLKAMYDADVIYPVDYWSSEGVAGIQNGDVAAHISAVWYAPTLTAVDEMSGKWGYVRVPKLEGIEGATQYSNIGGSSWVVMENSANKELAIDFLSTVFAGNLDFYEQILTEQAAVATYLPAADSEAYQQEVPFFNNNKIYADFAEWGSHIPEVDYGANTSIAEDALRAVLQDYLDGKIELDDMLSQAESIYAMQAG